MKYGGVCSLIIGSVLLAGALTRVAEAASAKAPALAGDGRVSTFNASGSGCGFSQWQQARLATSGDADFQSATRTFFTGAGCFGFTSMAVSRGYLTFDTSAIPANAVITSAQLFVYITGRQAIADGNDFIAVVQGRQPSATTLYPTDMTLAGSGLNGATEGANRVAISSIPLNAYQQWNLNASGLAWIARGGQTKLALRDGHDLVDALPDQAKGRGSFISIALSESGAAKAPYLLVNYTVAGTTQTDMTGPTVSLNSPAPNQTVNGVATLQASASDASGVAGVTFRVDGKTVGAEITSAPYSLVWDSAGTANGTHQVTAVARDSANNVSVSSAVTVSVNNPVAVSGTIRVNSGITYQTMSGWEATAQAGQDMPTYPLFRDTLLQQAVSDLGINRIRLEWKNSSGTAVDFADLDKQIVDIVNPMRALLQKRGEKLIVNLCYVGFNNGGRTYRTNPSAYASGLVSVFQYLKNRYGWIPDHVDVALEPDSGALSWTGAQVAVNLAAAGDALTALGFTPRFTASSTTSAPNTRSYFDAIAANPKALHYLSEISYHRYVNCDDKILAQIASRATTYNKATSMLEWIGATDATLHKDLKIGNNSAWQQFTLAYAAPDNGAQYYVVTNTSNPQVVMGSRTKRLRQYFKFIRSGAVRVDAATADARFDPVAFRHPNGKYVVVVQASAGGTFSISGLPAGTYGITYTTGSQYDVNPSDVTIVGGQNVNASIPAAGVITIHAR